MHKGQELSQSSLASSMDLGCSNSWESKMLRMPIGGRRKLVLPLRLRMQAVDVDVDEGGDGDGDGDGGAERWG